MVVEAGAGGVPQPPAPLLRKASLLKRCGRQHSGGMCPDADPAATGPGFIGYDLSTNITLLLDSAGAAADVPVMKKDRLQWRRRLQVQVNDPAFIVITIGEQMCYRIVNSPFISL